jgi:uncharacterized membrane protein
MANRDVIGVALGRAVREAADTLARDSRQGSNGRRSGSSGRLSGLRGVAVGAGLVALAPAVGKAVGKLTDVPGMDLEAPMRTIRENLGQGVSTIASKADEAGGATAIAKKAGKSVLPGADDEQSGADSGGRGVGSGRRMPVQQAIDVAVPVRTAYNQWTQFEDWPRFMHRVDRATQDDPTHVSFETKVWGVSRSFQAEIVEQQPDERIKWRGEGGVDHVGVVTFHQLSDRLTRIEVNLDVEPSSLLEKAGRGMRYVKRAVRADMARFKAHLEMEGKESGAWRGVIEDGKVKPRRKTSKAKSGAGGARSKGGSGSSGRRRGSSSNGRGSRSNRSRSRSRS